MHLQMCAIINGTFSDSGPCDIAGVPLGIFLILACVLSLCVVMRRRVHY